MSYETHKSAIVRDLANEFRQVKAELKRAFEGGHYPEECPPKCYYDAPCEYLRLQCWREYLSDE